MGILSSKNELFQTYIFLFWLILANFDLFGLFPMGIPCWIHVDSTWIPNEHSTLNPRRCDVDITSIRRRPNSDEFSRHFHEHFWCNFADRKIHVFSRTFFDVILMVEKSTLFPRTIFDVISMVERSTLFPHTFFDVISMVEKPTLFPRIFFDVISLVEISTAFLFTFFNLILMVEKSTLYVLFSKKFWWIRRHFW